jgi:hypothetical protein
VSIGESVTDFLNESTRSWNFSNPVMSGNPNSFRRLSSASRYLGKAIAVERASGTIPPPVPGAISPLRYMQPSTGSADQWITHPQLGEAAKVAVGRPELANAMEPTERRDASVVHLRPNDPTGQEDFR